MSTSVWLFKPRSHDGRKREGSRACNGAPLPGRPPSFRMGAHPRGPSPPPAAGLPLGGRACTDASRSALRLREEGAEATTLALTDPAAVVADGGAPAEGGSSNGADLALAADPAPGECLSEARYRLLRHAAVARRRFFGSSDISVFSPPMAHPGGVKGAVP